jgi:rRNA-processing protein FCF1
VQRDNGIFPFAQSRRQWEAQGLVKIAQQGVDHRIPDKVDSVIGDAFIPQVVARELIGCEEQIGHGIRAKAIDLLRHRHVSRTQAGFNMGNIDA